MSECEGCGAEEMGGAVLGECPDCHRVVCQACWCHCDDDDEGGGVDQW